jgi:hypothetical protein
MWIQPIHQSSITIENGEEVTLERQGVTGFMNCLKKTVMLVGDLAAIFTTRRREQVLIKLNPSLASLGKEEFPESGKQLFRDGFQALLKARSETARTVAVAHSAGKVVFFRNLPPGEGAATEQAVLCRASPDNIPQGSREPGLHSTGTLQLGSNTHDFRQQHQASIKAKPVLPPSMYLPFSPININCPTAGRLKHFLPNWEQITKDPWILQVEKGCQIDFSEAPVQVSPPKPMIVSVEYHLLNENEVQKLVTKGAIHFVSPVNAEKGFLSTLFLVPKKGGEQHPVVNVKPQNHKVQQVAKLVLVAPVCPAQPWYPLFLELCVDNPVLFPQRIPLLMRRTWRYTHQTISN